MKMIFLSLVTALVLAAAAVSSGCGGGGGGRNGNAASSGGGSSSLEAKLTQLSGHDVRNCRKDASSLVPDTASYECEVQDLVSKKYGPVNVYLDVHGNVVGSINW